MAKTPPNGTETSPPAKKARRPASTPMRHAFLTGFPGFIGRHLTARILSERSRASVSLLVHDKLRTEAEAWVKELPAGQAKRVKLLFGDVAKMDLGLSGPEIEALCASVTHVFHLAAVQYLGVSAEEAERVNVGGTRNVLMLAREMKSLKRLAHFSSCYVSGDRIGVITEDELDVGQTFRNHYERTKARAERLVRAAMSELPITVFRPSIVVGHSETGEIDRFDGIYTMGILIVSSPISVPLPLPGAGIAPLNMVPVDFVTKAALHLACRPDTEGMTFHLVDPNPLSSRHVYELIAKRAGKKLPRVSLSYSVAKRVLRLPFIERFSRVQAQALDYLNHLAIYNCANTLTYLEGSGILCPRFDSYVDRLMHFVELHLRQQRKSRRLSLPRPDPLDA